MCNLLNIYINIDISIMFNKSTKILFTKQKQNFEDEIMLIRYNVNNARTIRQTIRQTRWIFFKTLMTYIFITPT